MQTDVHAEVANVEECPEAGTDVCTLTVTERAMGPLFLLCYYLVNVCYQYRKTFISISVL